MCVERPSRDIYSVCLINLKGYKCHSTSLIKCTSRLCLQNYGLIILSVNRLSVSHTRCIRNGIRRFAARRSLTEETATVKRFHDRIIFIGYSPILMSSIIGAATVAIQINILRFISVCTAFFDSLLTILFNKIALQDGYRFHERVELLGSNLEVTISSFD